VTAVSPLLAASHVTKAFGGVVAVDDVSLAIGPSTVHGLIGPNGAGKSTLISLLSGFTRPDNGEIRFDGQDVTRVGPARLARLGLARTFQAATPLAGLTVLENVQVALTSKYRSGLLSVLARTPAMRREAKALAAQARELLADFGLLTDADRPARDLPFGKLRYLEIARALATRPRLLLLDEPAAGLNQVEVDELAVLIGRARAGGIAVLLVDHDVSFLFSICDQVTVLNFGKVVVSGPAAEVHGSKLLREAYLGPALPADPDPPGTESRRPEARHLEAQ
jgi:ABC-type branched-subunit amino acid transport system ATPase component